MCDFFPCPCRILHPSRRQHAMVVIWQNGHYIVNRLGMTGEICWHLGCNFPAVNFFTYHTNRSVNTSQHEEDVMRLRRKCYSYSELMASSIRGPPVVLEETNNITDVASRLSIRSSGMILTKLENNVRTTLIPALVVLPHFQKNTGLLII